MEAANVRAPQNFKDLLVWQRGMALAKRIYEITRTFPSDERFGLVAQMRRAAVSIPSNIAEGQARHTTGEFVQFISHAEGSLAELETQLRLSLELGFCLEREIQNDFQLMEELRKMLNSLRCKLVTRH
jgi:four helix bundle protein